jgi:hypothetical protein
MAEDGSGGAARAIESARRLGDDDLLARLPALAADERRETGLFLAHLAEVAARELHLRAGYSSLFVYCRDGLALSEHESYNRVEVARAVRRFPVLLEMIEAGALNVITARLLAPHLTPENHHAVLESARGRRRPQVEEIVARLAPFPEAPSVVRKLPPPRVPPPEPRPPEPPFARVTAPAAPPAAPPRPAPSGDVTPLAPDRYRLQVTISGATVDKLRLAQDMLRHAVPSGDEAAVLDRALTALLAELARAKFAATTRSGAPRPAAPGSRHVPAEVKREVWLRDLGRCAFVSPDGRRCGERAFVEFHHVRPFAAGGEATTDNIQLRCRRHNGYEARVFFAGSRANG